MERIRLSKEEKQVLRLPSSGMGCPDTFPFHVFVAGVVSLERKGLVKCEWTEGHRLADAGITGGGKAYLMANSSLRNGCHCRYESDSKWILIAVFALSWTALCLAAAVIILSHKISGLQTLINQLTNQ